MQEQSNTYKLSENLIYNLECIARIARVSGCRYFEECDEIDVTFNEAVIIDTLHTHPKIHQRDLAKMLIRGTANLSRELAKLEDRGLIQRNIDTKGKRVVKTLMLTLEGEKVYQDVTRHIYTQIKNIESVFSAEEYLQFKRLLLKLKNKLTESCDMIFE